MAPRRETSVREVARNGAELWADVEEDVEKKRHVKDPFREAYVALVAAPFDAFLAKRARDTCGEEDDGEVDMEWREDEDEVDTVEDHVALQQEISARSQQVHLRLEILRRQMQSLVEESSAVLDTDILGPKKETHKRKKAPAMGEPLGDESGDGSIINLEKLLDRVALYERGELTVQELQKTWRHHQCPHEKHEVIGANAKLESMRTVLEEDFQSIRDQNLLYFGPRLPIEFTDANTTSSPKDSQMAQFLEDCKRSIRPFFLEDFVELDVEDSQPGQDCENNDAAAWPDAEHDKAPIQSSASAVLPDEDVIMSDVENASSESTFVDESVAGLAITERESSQRSSRERDDDAFAEAFELQPSRFCIKSVQASRHVFHKKAAKIKVDCPRSEKLPVRLSAMSRQSVDSVKSSKRPACTTRPSPLVCDSKKWGKLSMSVIDPAINLVELRHALSRELDEPLDDEQVTPLEALTYSAVEPTSPPPTTHSDVIVSQFPTACNVATQAASTHAKRQLDIVEESKRKKPRVNPLSLRMMVQSIRDVFRRVAQTSCVSYLSTILRSGMNSSSPQRAFVALVFSASLTNTTQEHPEANHADKPLRITLQSANAGRDVKIICCQE